MGLHSWKTPEMALKSAVASTTKLSMAFYYRSSHYGPFRTRMCERNWEFKIGCAGKENEPWE